MLCDKCKKNQATTYYKTNLNGQITEMHLCTKCAQQSGIFQDMNPFGLMNSGFGAIDSMLSGLMGFENTKGIGNTLVCPVCHSTLDDISRTGKVGCAACYDTFENALMPYIRKIHGNAAHTGRIPSHCAASPKRRIKELERELATAVAAQEYERAAEIRDELKALKEGE